MSLDTDLISGSLVIATIGLIYATLRLKSATDNLGRNEILPHLSREKYVWNAEKQTLFVKIKNTGFGTAYSLKSFATTATGVRFEITTVPSPTQPMMADLEVGQNIGFVISVETSAFREMRLHFEYQDAKGYPYKQDIIAPK